MEPKEEHRAARDRFFRFDFAREVAWLIDLLRTTPSEILFCHNDLHGGNVLVFPDERIMLIDYEYAAYGYRCVVP